MVAFTPDEKRLIVYAKKAIVKYNKKRKARGEFDTIYSFVMSDSGKIYDGACLESAAHGSVCAERHSIANMVLKEGYKTRIKCILVADPVPKVQKKSTTPCGTCRHVIWERGQDATVICLQYMRQKNGWIFPAIQKHTVQELYRHPYTQIKWD